MLAALLTICSMNKIFSPSVALVITATVHVTQIANGAAMGQAFRIATPPANACSFCQGDHGPPRRPPLFQVDPSSPHRAREAVEKTSGRLERSWARRSVVSCGKKTGSGLSLRRRD